MEAPQLKKPRRSLPTALPLLQANGNGSTMLTTTGTLTDGSTTAGNAQQGFHFQFPFQLPGMHDPALLRQLQQQQQLVHHHQQQVLHVHHQQQHHQQQHQHQHQQGQVRKRSMLSPPSYYQQQILQQHQQNLYSVQQLQMQQSQAQLNQANIKHGSITQQQVFACQNTVQGRIPHVQAPCVAQNRQVHNRVSPVNVRRIAPKMDDLLLPSDHEHLHPAMVASNNAGPPWSMLPRGLTMPLQAGSHMTASSHVDGMRRMRVDEWKHCSNGNYVPLPGVTTPAVTSSRFMPPPSFGGSFAVPPRPSSSKNGPMLSPPPSAPPSRTTSSPDVTEKYSASARALAIEKRRAKLREVSAFYQAECEAHCKRLLALQREVQEELKATKDVPCLTLA